MIISEYYNIEHSTFIYLHKYIDEEEKCLERNIIKNLNFEMRKNIKKHENDSFALDNLLILKHLTIIFI